MFQEDVAKVEEIARRIAKEEIGKSLKSLTPPPAAPAEEKAENPKPVTTKTAAKKEE
jgi:hypothetical protein